MSKEKTAKKLLCSTLIAQRSRGHPRTCWQDYIEDLSWFCLGIPAEHLSFVAEDRDAWRLQLEMMLEYTRFVDMFFHCVQAFLYG